MNKLIKNIKGFIHKGEISFETVDYKKRRVVWYKNSYDSHMKNRPEIKTNMHLVKKFLLNPNLWNPKPRRPDDEEYLIPFRSNFKDKQFYIKLIISYNAVPAYIRTAYTTSDTSGFQIK